MEDFVNDVLGIYGGGGRDATDGNIGDEVVACEKAEAEIRGNEAKKAVDPSEVGGDEVGIVRVVYIFTA